MSSKFGEALVTMAITLIILGTLGYATRHIAREAVTAYFDDQISVGRWNRNLSK